MMVVVPTSHDVKLTYGLTAVDWLGRFVTLLGLVGLGVLVVWKGAAALRRDRPSGDDAAASDGPDAGR